METWIWMLIVYRIFASTSPFTSKIGAILGWITAVAVPIFCILCFFFAGAWWYGLVAWGIYFLGTLLIPKIDADNAGTALCMYSAVVSHLQPVIVLLMYLSLFKII